MRSRLFVYLFLGLFLACTNKPMYVMSDKKMEDVLFDLYIVEVGINENSMVFYNDSVKKKELLQSVFKKHKTTQAKFDTSLVWYNANLKRYLKINTQVIERYDRWIDHLQAQIQKANRLLGNNIRFEDLKLHESVKPFLSFWLTDILTVPVDTTRRDTIMPFPENIYRYERICFYEEPVEPPCRYERISFYEEEE